MYTAPLDSCSPASINDQDDMDASLACVWPALRDGHDLQQYDGVLVACYSAHPLVHTIAAHCPQLAVTGILEASIVATLPLLRSPSSSSSAGGAWGIVTTGSFWEAHLTDAVQRFLTGQAGQNTAIPRGHFCGVFTTGLNASDFHGGGVPPHTVTQKLKDATRTLLRTRDVDCVVMGCAGMAGLEDIIRSTAVDEYGGLRARRVYVIDGVRAGIGVLEHMVQNRRMFLPE